MTPTEDFEPIQLDQDIPEDEMAGELMDEGPEAPMNDWDLFPVLHPTEIEAIKSQVDTDLRNAASDHAKRIERYKIIYGYFRKLADPVAPGEEDDSGVRVPLVQWSTFQQAAAEFNALFGQGARVKCEPSNEMSSAEMANLVGAFMGSLAIDQMKLGESLMVFLIYRALFGRAYAYRPWKIETNSFIDDSGQEQEEVYYSGPGFSPLWPGDVMRPGMDELTTIQKMPWSAIRRRYFVSELIAGEQRGEFHGITENLNDIYAVAGRGISSDWHMDELQMLKREASGADPHDRSDPRGQVIVYEMYTRRNLPIVEGPVGDMDWKNRELMPSDVVVHYCPALGKIIGIHDLKRLYPRMQNRRPIFESAQPFGDTYERQGLGELLWDLEGDLTSNERQFTDAVRRSAQGFGFHDPTSGLPAENFQIQPGFSHAVGKADAVKWVNPTTDFQAFMIKQQSVLSIAERITGQSDFSMGRSPDRPNAPRTATGQTLMVQMGNVRIAVSMLHLQMDLNLLMSDLWAMWVSLGDEQTTFRLIESDRLEGMLDTAGNGLVKLTAQERNGRYNFRFIFAPSEVEKQLKKQQAFEAYSVSLQNPLIASNPVALWEVTNELMKELGYTWFAAKVPRPADPGTPKDPNAEWALMLQGMDVEPSPAENFQVHLTKHKMQYQKAMANQDSLDADAIHRLETHIVETEMLQQQVMQQQQMMLAMATQAAQQVGAAKGQGAQPAQQPQEQVQ